MSVKIGAEVIPNIHISGQATDSFGLPVEEESSSRKDKENVISPSPRGKSYGVRVPVLNDLNSKYVGKHTACRFDIVEKVTTVIKQGSYGPEAENDAMMLIKSPGRESEDLRKIHFSRQPTFHSTLGSHSTKFSDQKDTSVVDKIGPYHWNKWVRSGKEGDARDVLYKNTYCLDPEFLRYRSLTLPRIATPADGERPWTVAGNDIHKPAVLKSEQGEYSKVVTIVPQQPRGTVVKFREYMRPCTIASDGNSLEVRRFNSQQDPHSHFTTAKNVFPLIRQDFRKSPKRQDRPLKFENSRYLRGNKGTLFSKHILPAFKNAFDRDYSSADTFKEYLDSLQQTAKANTPGMHSREMTGYRHFDKRHSMDYHNRVLQSVSDVNQPNAEQQQRSQCESSTNQLENPIKVEIKPHVKELDVFNENLGQTSQVVKKAHTIDNLSSVRGSVIQARSDTQSNMPMSSSIVGGKSIAKAPSVLSVKDNVTTDNPTGTVAPKPPSRAGSEKAHSVVSVVLPTANVKQPDEEDAPCPTNTPTPDDV